MKSKGDNSIMNKQDIYNYLKENRYTMAARYETEQPFF